MSPDSPGAAAVVLSAPSGTGKTSIAKALVEGSEDFVFSVSATTRPARDHETDGVHYQFVEESDFQAMLDADELLEWAEVHGHLYGTPERNLSTGAKRGQHVVMDIDVQGAVQVRTRVPDAVLVFILPPSADALVGRLRGRGTEGDHALTKRLQNAREELERARDFDYVVVNETLEQAVDEVRAIATGQIARDSRAIDLPATIRQLQERIDEILAAGFGPAPS